VHADGSSGDHVDGHLAEYAHVARSKIVVVDQLEKLFTQCHDDERREFLDLLTESATPAGALVVCGPRAGFDPSCVDYPSMRKVLADRPIAVGAMSPNEPRAASYIRP
jgi:hypothetical protein